MQKIVKVLREFQREYFEHGLQLHIEPVETGNGERPSQAQDVAGAKLGGKTAGLWEVGNDWRDKYMKMSNGKYDQKVGLALGSLLCQRNLRDTSSGEPRWKARGGKA